MWKTPASLKWLITKRSRLSGTLLRLESDRAKCFARIEAINAKMSLVERDLLGIDLTLPQHEISVEPKEIRPVKPHQRKALLGYGQLGRLLLQVLRNSDNWLTARELTSRIGAHIEGFDSIDPRYTLECVRRRLNQLARKGVVERQWDAPAQHRAKGDAHGRWRLVKTDVQLTNDRRR
jgi:hypothetical protein